MSDILDDDGKWRIEIDDETGETPFVLNEFGELIACFFDEAEGGGLIRTARAIACVNACHGLSIEQVRERLNNPGGRR